MRKAVAIPYVIALILGVIVIGILGYWFFTQGGKTIGAGVRVECQGKLFSYCVSWQAAGIDNPPDVGKFDWTNCEDVKTIAKDVEYCKKLGVEIKK